MGEDAAQTDKPAKHRRKSQLRHEVHYDSAGEKSQSPAPAILEPDSQFAVPETQVTDMAYAKGREVFAEDINEVGDDLGAEDAATLARYSAPKKKLPEDPATVDIHFLARSDISQIPSLSHMPFSFPAMRPGPARQTALAVRKNSEIAAAKVNMSSQEPPGNHDDQADVRAATKTCSMKSLHPVPPAVSVPVSTSKGDDRSDKHLTSLTDRPQDADPPDTTTRLLNRHVEFKSQAETSSTLSHKSHNVKAQKKSKRPRRVHCGAEWPPKTKGLSNATLPRPIPEDIEHSTAVITANAPPDANSPPGTQLLPIKGTDDVPVNAGAFHLQDQVAIEGSTPCVTMQLSHPPPTSDAQAIVHEERTDTGVLVQDSQALVQETQDQRSNTQMDRDFAASSQGPATAFRKIQAQRDVPMSSVETPPCQTIQPSQVLQQDEKLLERGNDMLHHVSDHSSNVRVSKLSQKRRARSQHQPNTRRTPATQVSHQILSPVGQALAALSVAFAQEEEHKMSVYATETRQLREVNDLLQQQNALQATRVEEWKNKHCDLQTNVSQLRERAKTNQKFVVGLQSDYEKLQKSATSCQAECKKALQSKIAEVEAERQSLAKEFDRTLDVVSSGQKNLKRFADDLYIRLLESESKRKGLVVELNQVAVTHEQNGTLREHVDQLIQSATQALTQQANERSTWIEGKLDAIDRMLQMDKNSHMREEVTESLSTLRKLQERPFLTAKDVEKSEHMLRFMNQCIQAKLHTFAQTLDGHFTPNKDGGEQPEAHISELFDKLRDREMITAENTEYKKSNNLLSQQLESEQQRSQQMNEQLAELKLTVQRLTTRQSQHDTERAQWQDQRKEAELQEALEDARKARLDLEMMVKEKMELDQKLQVQQCSLQDMTSRLAEATSLNERLQSQEKLITARNGTIAALECRVSDQETEIADMQSSSEQMKLEYAQQLAEKDRSLQEAHVRERQHQEDDRETKRQAHQQQLALHDEKEELQKLLTQCRAAVIDLTEINTALHTGKDAMSKQCTDACTRVYEVETKLQNLRIEQARALQSLQGHVNDLQQQLTDGEAALREAEARLRLQEAEHKKKLEFDRNEYQRMLEESVCLQENRSQSIDHQSSRTLMSRAALGPNADVRNSRKRINRDNSSVLLVQNMSDEASSLLDDDRDPNQASEDDPSQGRTLFDDFGPDDDDDINIIDLAAEPVEDTQEPDNGAFTSNLFGKSSQHKSRKDLAQTRANNSSGSSSLSEANSELIEQLSNDARRESASPLAERSSLPRNLHAPTKRSTKASNQYDGAAASDTRSSQSTYRPRSQANMASRMMQPSALSVKNVAKGQLFDPRTPDEQLSQSQGGSTPDFIQDAFTRTKQTYRHHNLRHHHESVKPAATQPNRQGPSQKKRKIDHEQEQRASPKRRRSSQTAANATKPTRSVTAKDFSRSQTTSASSIVAGQTLSRLSRKPSVAASPRMTMARVPPSQKGGLPIPTFSGNSRSGPSSTRCTRSKSTLEDRFNRELQGR